MGISSLSLVSGVNPAGEDALPDGAFQLAGRSVIPALDGAVPGGPGAVARFFFRLYSGPAAGTPEVAFEIFQNGRQIVRKPLIGGRVYALPLSFTMDVRLRKRALVWNEVSFRSYQRFTADSHFLPARQ
jgi:hypothetical protein